MRLVNRCHLFFLCLLLAAGCNHISGNSLANVNELSVQADSLNIKRSCRCEDSVKQIFHPTEVGFWATEEGKYNFNRDFERLSQDSIRLKIKSITFSNYDTIPIKFRIFENVETVHSSTTYGLDMFPRLKNVSFFFEDVYVDSTMKWPYRIEAITLEKCRVFGLTSFKHFHNLTYLNVGYTFFKSPLRDIQSLSCLQILIFGAHMEGSIKLEQIDLSRFSCLREMTWHSWVKDVDINGIPKGLDERSAGVKLEISHPNLTAAEIIKLKEFNKLAGRTTKPVDLK